MANVKEILAESIFEVFERMFFIFLEPGSASPVHDCEAAIRFDGPRRGTMRMLFTRPVARLMVRNMLGLDNGAVTEQHVADCVKEAANMVCGNFLVHLDASKKFTMTLPEFSARPGQPPAAPGDVVSFDFDCDDGKMRVVLEWRVQG
jgi:CheY-specific phosphatase CheX